MPVKDEIQVAVQSGTPVLVWGPPGVGKTATIQAVGRAMNLPVEVVIASIREPSDFLGLPIVHDGEARFAPPAWAKRLAQAGRGILFLDEVSTAPPAVQAALLRVVLDRVVGDLALPEEIAVVAAANPPEQAAGGWDLTPPLANRFTHLHFRVDPSGWVAEFPSYWGNPPSLPGLPEAQWAPARALVAAFIRRRPHLLLQLPENESQAGQAWPSPRSWDMASRMVARSGDRDTLAALVCGCVGEGAGMEFLAWQRDLDLPDPEELLANPERFKLPERGDQAYAVLSSVATAAAGNLTKERWAAAWRIMGEAAAQGGKDVAAVSVRTLARARRPDLALPPELREFVPLLQKAGDIGE